MIPKQIVAFILLCAFCQIAEKLLDDLVKMHKLLLVIVQVPFNQAFIHSSADICC